MTHDNYILYILGTISNYPAKNVQHLKKIFVKAGIAQIDEQFCIENVQVESVDVRDLETASQVEACIKSSLKAVKLFEKWEFEKDFKYSVLFETADFDIALQSVNETIQQVSETEDEENNIFDGLEHPIKYSNDAQIFIKFNISYAAINPLTGEELFLKYPVLIVFHTLEKIIEFRFDSLRKYFIPEKSEQTIYADLVNDLKTYCNTYLNIELIALDLDFMTTESNQQSEFKVISQYRKLSNGGNAQLDVGNNQDYVLPIIGELKELLKRNVIELEKVPSLKEELEQFIFENDELADYSWIEVMWENELKTRNIRVKFIYNYRNSGYCLLQHYFSTVLIGMERMNHVVKYISQHRPDATQQG